MTISHPTPTETVLGWQDDALIEINRASVILVNTATMDGIATITMNPALDVTSTTDRIIATEKLRCTAPRHDPGGGGINVARAVRALGGDAIAVFPVGGLVGQRLQQLLNEEQVPVLPVTIAESCRQSFMIDEGETGLQFRFIMPGPSMSAIEQEGCLDRLTSLEPKPRYVVGSGSLPPGVSIDFYARLAERVRTLGAQLIVDTSGEALRQAGCDRIYLLKPSLRELQLLLAREIKDEAQQESAARELVKSGRCEVAVLSLGAAGALVATVEGCWRFAAPTVRVRSTVGAGDSMVAGIVLSLVRGLSILEAVRFGVAAGGAALMRPGTELCDRKDTERLLAQTCEPIACDA